MPSRKTKYLQVKEYDENGLTTSLLRDVSAGFSTYDTVDNCNVSFINISYIKQPKPFLAHFKKIPPKIILENVR